jgi:hypothetical protein
MRTARRGIATEKKIPTGYQKKKKKLPLKS